MALKNIAKAILLTSIDSSTVAGTYAPINTTGLPNGCFLIRIMNASTQDVTVSFDGTNNNEYVLSETTLQLDFGNNNSAPNYVCNMPQGTKVYVKGTAGVGFIYLSGYYQPTQ